MAILYHLNLPILWRFWAQLPYLIPANISSYTVYVANTNNHHTDNFSFVLHSLVQQWSLQNLVSHARHLRKGRRKEGSGARDYSESIIYMYCCHICQSLLYYTKASRGASSQAIPIFQCWILKNLDGLGTRLAGIHALSHCLGTDMDHKHSLVATKETTLVYIDSLSLRFLVSAKEPPFLQAPVMVNYI